MRRLLQVTFPVVALATLIFVWSTSIDNNGGLSQTFSGDLSTVTYHLFRLAGLTTFTLVSFQIMTGPYMKFWEQLYGKNFYKFHGYEGLFVLVFATLHPMLLLTYEQLNHIGVLAFASNYPFQYYFGPIAWTLIITTVSTAALAVLLKRPKFYKSWHGIHLLNYVVFLLAFFHSLAIGTDVSNPTSQLRPLWYFFFVMMVCGLIYRRIYRPFKEKNIGLN